MTPKTALYALSASVVLNVFLVGVLLGPRLMRPKMGPREKMHLEGPRGAELRDDERLRRGPRPPNRPDGDERGERRLLRGLVDALGGPRSPRVSELLEKSRAAREEQRREIEAAREGVARALVGSPYDEASLRAKLAAVGELERKQKDAAQSTIVELSRLLGDEERARLRERVGNLEGPRN